VAADAWRRLPVASGAAGVVLNVFAPRSGAEFRRILHPDGRLVVVTPGPGHLAELAGPLGLLAVDPRKEERLATALGPFFELTARRDYGTVLSLDRAGTAQAAAMGPSAWHAAAGDLAARAAALPGRVRVTVSVTLSEFRPRP
jgi:23S rRNA (guanine745-N1)-methyltransferase